MSRVAAEGEHSADVLREEVSRDLEGLGVLWSGEDATALEDRTLYPQETSLIWARASENALPPIRYDSSTLPILSDELNVSVRSRLAQSGLTTLSRRLEIDEDDKVNVVFEMTVLGGRPVKLNAGDGVACFFSTSGARMIQGLELYEELVGQEHIRIGGKFGEDWRLVGLYDDRDDVFFTDKVLAKQAVGVALRIKEERFGIPDGNEPIDIGGEVGYRTFLDNKVFKVLKPDEHVSFWVGETRSEVFIPPGYNGFLNMAGNIGTTWVFQTRSLLIKGGRTNWPLRYEFHNPVVHGENVRQPTPEDYTDQYLIMHVFVDKETEGRT